MSSAVPVGMANAASLYWDGASTGPNADGGVGTWSTAVSPANWDSAATGGSDVAWTDGSDAVFGGVGNVVTVSGTVSATSLSFNSQSYRLTGGQVNLTGTPVIATGANNVTLEPVIGGSVAISKTGTGTLTIGGNNAFSGAFTVSEGTVKLTSGSAFGVTTNGTTISSGATLDVNGKGVGREAVTFSGTGVGGAGAIINSGVATFNALEFLSMAGAATVGGTGFLDVSTGGSLAMNGNTLTKIGANEFLINTSITSPGHIDVKEGTLSFNKSSTINGNSTNTVTIRTGAVLSTTNPPSFMSWTAVLEAGTTWKAAGSSRWDGPVTLAGTTTFDADYSTAINQNGVISGAGSITKTGPGAWRLRAVNTFTGGIAVNAGNLVLEVDTPVSNIPGTVRGAVTVNSGGTLTLNRAENLGTVAATRVSPLNIAGGLVDNAAFANNSPAVINLTGGRLRSNGGVASAVTLSSYTMSDNAVINGLAAASPSVISGRLRLGAGNTGNTTVFNIADGTAADDLRIDAAITGAATANGITKRGTGVMTLRGPALHMGSTVVEEGTLLIDGAGTMTDSPVTVAAGARFGTTAGGKSVASLTAQGGSSLILPALTSGATVVEGTLNLASGNIAICPVIGDATPTGTYDLLVADSITGSGVPFLDAGGAFGSTRVTGSVVVNGNKLQLIVTGVGSGLTWNNASAGGAANGTWDSALANFTNGVSNDTFRAFDSVTFDDSVAPGSKKIISLGTNVAPARVTVDNSNGDYVFSSTGRLAGVGALVKTGSGKLTVDGPYGYAMTGGITAGGGVLDFNGQSISASSLVLQSGGALNNATIATGPMQLLSGSSNATLSGSASWSKTSEDNVTLTANSALTGAGTIVAGHLFVGNVDTPDTLGSLGSGSVAIFQGGGITFSHGGAGTTATTDVTNSFSGPGSLNFVGSTDAAYDVTIFNVKGNSRSLTGPVSATNAMLSVTSGSQLGSGALLFSGRGGLAVDGTTVLNAIKLTKIGGDAGSLKLGNATLSGPITLPGAATTLVSSTLPNGSHSVISGPIGQAGGGAASLSLGTGSNTFTLSGASNYTGSTFISGTTTVNLTGSLGATAVSVGTFATLGGNGSIGAGGSLAFSNKATLRVAMSGGPLTVNGNVDLGLNTVVLLDVSPDAVMTGPIPVLDYTGTLTGGPGSLTIDGPENYRNAQFSFTPGHITLDVGTKALVWKGVNGSWDSTSIKNWGETDAGAATDFFYKGDSVLFNDSGPGGSVTGQAVWPSSVVVDNSTKDYGISNAINGPCSVTKRGSGTLYLSGYNSYTGGTVVEAGRLEAGSSLGVGPVSVAAGASLGGSGTLICPVTVAGTLDPGSVAQPGASHLATGTLVLSGNYHCELDTQESDWLEVTGDLDLTGATLTVSQLYPFFFSEGSNVIASYTGMLTGGFTSVSGLPSGFVVKYDTAAKQILLVLHENYAEWAASFDGLSDTTADGDPDHDGIPNLVEWVVGGNASASDAAVLPTQSIEGGDLVFRYKRNDMSVGQTIQTVQWSADMKTWTDINIPASSASPVTVTANGSQPDDIEVRIPRIPGSMYVRLKVTES